MKTITIKDLLPFCATPKEEPVRPALHGVFYSEGWAVATTPFLMVATKFPYPSENEGKIINKKGETIDAKFPKWQMVMPQENPYTTNQYIFDYKVLEEYCNALKRWGNKENPLCIKFGDGCYKAEHIKKILPLLKKIKPSYIKQEDKIAGKFYIKENEACILIMPVLLNNPIEGQILTYPENKKL